MNLEEIKENAIAFYKLAFEGAPKKAVDPCSGKLYSQHNPDVEDEPEGFIIYFDRMCRDYPMKSISFICSIAEAELVPLHTHQIWSGKEEFITMDFFRYNENGKIVEQWDTIEKIPEKAVSNNTMN